MASFKVDEAVSYIQEHAHPATTHNCGTYTRKAIAAGGIQLTNHLNAGDYGSSLLAAGFQSIGQATSGFQKGDVVVFKPSAKHINGHMAMYDGKHWVSDYNQRSIFIYADMPPYTIYRHVGN